MGQQQVQVNHESHYNASMRYTLPCPHTPHRLPTTLFLGAFAICRSLCRSVSVVHWVGRACRANRAPARCRSECDGATYTGAVLSGAEWRTMCSDAFVSFIPPATTAGNPRNMAGLGAWTSEGPRCTDWLPTTTRLLPTANHQPPTIFYAKSSSMLFLDGVRRQRLGSNLASPRLDGPPPHGRDDGTGECHAVNKDGALTTLSSSSSSSQPLRSLNKDQQGFDLGRSLESNEPTHPIPDGISLVRQDASSDRTLTPGSARRVSSPPQKQLRKKGVPRCAAPALLSSLEPGPPIEVSIALRPWTDSVIMFGTTQTTTHYSLAGTAILTLSSSRPTSTLCELQQQSGMGVHIKGITVSFTGYSLYHDYVGRSTAIKLTEVKQQLLPPEGEHVPLSDVLYPTKAQAHDHDHATTLERAPTYPTVQGNRNKLQLEMEFDLAVPGCLPPSLRTAFGSAFYTLQAQVDFGMSPLPTSIQHDVPIPNDVSMGPTGNATNWSVLLPATPASPTSVSAPNTLSDCRDKSLPPAPTAPSSTVIPSMNITDPAPLASSYSSSKLSSPSSSSQHTTLPATGRNLKTKSPVSSPAMIILLRRCRDVVPAPLARVVHGNLVGIPMDPPVSPTVSPSARPVARSCVGTHDPTERSGPSATLPVNQPTQLPSVPHKVDPSLTTGPEASHATATQRTLGNNNSTQPDQQPAMPRSTTNAHSIPQRHFVQRFELQPPPDLVHAAKDKVWEAQQLVAERGKEVDQPKVDSHYATTLPVRLALSVPSHVHTRGNNLGSLRFSIQLSLGDVGTWAQKYLRRNGGLRLRSMELTCTQTEKHR